MKTEMMRIELNKTKFLANRLYISKHDELVILCTKYVHGAPTFEGVVVHSSDDLDYYVGQHKDSWIACSFVDFYGVITMRSE